MPDAQMRRTNVAELFDSASQPHAGLWLARGLPEWKEKADKKGEDFQHHIATAAKLKVPEIYQKAYQRWEKNLLEANAQTWCGKLDGRLFIGLGGASVLETAITLSRTYGVPIIPGSAVKGLVRAYAEKQNDLDDAQKKTLLEVLFGKIGDKPEESDAGYVLFHDAWWIPEDKPPLAAEIVTVHHQDYYNGSARQATDFDSPVPNQQIAARGSFLFALECADPEWAKYAKNLLTLALAHWGIGGKTAAGYGRFVEDKKQNDAVNKKREDVETDKLPPEQKMRKQIEALSLKKIAEMLGKDKNKTLAEWGADKELKLNLIRQIHSEALTNWKNSQSANEKKAFKVIFPTG
jgi:CRISPR-associated protein Cmr6